MYISLQYHASFTQTIKKKESHNFLQYLYNICIVYGKFEDFRSFQDIFMSAFWWVFVRYELLASVQVATFFSAEDSSGFIVSFIV